MLLLFSQFLAIYALELFFNFRYLFLVLFLLFCFDCTRSLLLEFWCFGLDVIFWRGKVYLNVSLNTTDLVIGFGFNNIYQVVSASILDIDRASLVQHRVKCQFLLQATKVISLSL